MSFLKAIHKKEIVFIINQKTVDDVLVKKIIETTSSNKKIGLDMQNVETINSSLLIEYLIQNKIKLFNPKSEILAYLSLVLKDGFLKSYINFSDFSNNKRELIKRHFLIA